MRGIEEGITEIALFHIEIERGTYFYSQYVCVRKYYLKMIKMIRKSTSKHT